MSIEMGMEWDPAKMTLDQQRAYAATPWTQLHYRLGSSDKFYALKRSGIFLAVRWGRRGTNGQSIVRKYSSAEGARERWMELFKEKVAKGYRLFESPPDVLQFCAHHFPLALEPMGEATGFSIPAVTSSGNLYVSPRSTAAGGDRTFSLLAPPSAPTPKKKQPRPPSSGIAAGRFAAIKSEDEEDDL